MAACRFRIDTILFSLVQTTTHPPADQWTICADPFEKKAGSTRLLMVDQKRVEALCLPPFIPGVPGSFIRILSKNECHSAFSTNRDHLKGTRTGPGLSHC